MLQVLIDTSVWLDLAKDYRHQPTLHALAQMIEAGEVQTVLPRQALDEFARNKERIVKESRQSLSGTLKRVKDAVRQFGRGENQVVLASLDDVDHRISNFGEAVNDSIRQIEAIFSRSKPIESTEA